MLAPNHFLLNREQTPENVLKALLVIDHICVQSTHNSPIKNYTEVFYTDYEGDSLSIQCKMKEELGKEIRVRV
jgi:hypothetical protein